MFATRSILVLVLTFVFMCGLSVAQTTPVPPLVKFNGAVADHSGTIGITFSLYAMKQGGTPLWLETQSVQLDSQGHYSVFLGASQKQGLPLDIFSGGEARWLGIKPEDQEEQPRVLLVSVPYALKANDAETLGGKPPSAYVLASTQSTILAATEGSPIAVQGGVPAPNFVSSGVAGYIPKFTNSTDISTSNVFADASGTRTGINTFTPEDNLHINGNLLLKGGVTHSVRIVGQASTGRLGQDFGGFFFAVDTPGKTMRVLTTPTGGSLTDNRFVVTSTGNVGIGTANPGSLLSVTGTIESTSGGFKFPDASTQVSAGISQSVADTRYLSSSGGLVSGSLSATSFSGNGSGLTNLNAANLSGTIPSNLLNGTYSNPLTFNNVSNSFSGNGSGLTNLSAANLSGTVNSSNLPPQVAYNNTSNSFSATQFLNSGAFVGVVGTGNSGTALNINNNDSVNPTIKVNNNGGGDYLTMDGSGNGHFAFHGDGYFESNGWAPSIPYDSVGNPVSPGQVVKFTAAGTVVPMATTDNTGAIGIVAQTIPADQNNPTQSETVLSGVANCLFDNTAVVGDYVNISSTSAGKCHDVGPNLPNVGQVLGRVVEVNNGKNQVYLAGGSEIRMAPFFVRKLKLFSQSTALATTTLFTAGLSGTYRVSVYLDSGNTASGTITANLGWTDDIGAQSATVGTITPSQQYDSKTMVVRALVGNNITYSTQFSGVSGTPSYNLVYIIELIETD